MSVPRPKLVPDDEPVTAEFEVDEHGAESAADEPTAGAPESAAPTEVTPPIALGWTPEEATALVCALWNLGVLFYGPEWTADPRETLGWNGAVAQLLDTYVPKDTGGMVQTGAGLLMIGNGVVMMGARRYEIIRRGPRPMWVRKPAPDIDATPQAPPPPPTPAPDASGNGHYRMPADLVPRGENPLSGIGL